MNALSLRHKHSTIYTVRTTRFPFPLTRTTTAPWLQHAILHACVLAHNTRDVWAACRSTRSGGGCVAAEEADAEGES